MDNLDKEIAIDGVKYKSIIDYLKEVLVITLIDYPPKRLNGNSDWFYQLATGMANIELLEGGVSPCCAKGDYCGGEIEPCSYSHNADTQTVNKTLKTVIDAIGFKNKQQSINWQPFDPDNPPTDTDAEYLVEGKGGGFVHCHTTGKCFFVDGMIIEFCDIKAYAIINPSNL